MCTVKTLSIAMATSVATALAASPVVSAAQITVSQRDTIQQLSFSDTSAFSDTSLVSDSSLTIAGNTGDTLSLGWAIPHGATGFSAGATSGFSVSAPVFTSGSPNDTESFTVTALNTPSSGTLAIAGHLGVNVAPSGADTTISTGVSGLGYHFLDATFDPAANQSAGATFFYEALIPGNYSAAGTATGQHELLSLNPAWTVTQNFVFNGTDTVFEAQISNYDPSADRIGLDYQIYGSPVPLPAAVWLLLSGLVPLSLLRRIRSS